MEKPAQLLDAAGRPFVCEAPNEQVAHEGVLENLKYMAVGTMFGIVFVKAEVVSWFRIQEMFRFSSFHMYGVIGVAVVVGMISMFLIRTFRIKTKGQIYGGVIFGLGWALTGACPGPLFAQIGAGFPAVAVTLVSAVTGTWLYGYFREKLPH
jgi:uncharacterized protein